MGGGGGGRGGEGGGNGIISVVNYIILYSTIYMEIHVHSTLA